jgi:hypothetical protein
MDQTPHRASITGLRAGAAANWAEELDPQELVFDLKVAEVSNRAARFR